MYKVLVVDDEARERNIIKILLDRYFPETFLISEAENGLVALDKIKEENFDILIIDIKMPGLDGMNVIREVNNISKNIYTIIITAYNYFEYAKEAIKLDVDDLLLKPPVREEFSKSINKFIKYCETKNSQNSEDTIEKMEAWLNLMKKDIVRSLMHGGSQYTEEYIDILDYNYKWGSNLIVTFDTCHENHFESNQAELERVLSRISKKIEQISYESSLQTVTDTYGSNVVVFLFSNEEKQQNVIDANLETAKEIYDIIQNNCQYKIRIGLGSPYALVNDMYKSFMESKKSIQQKDENVIVKAISVYSGVDSSVEAKVCFEKQLIKSIRNNDKAISQKIFIELYSEYITKDRNEINSLKVKMIDILGSVSKETIDHQEALKQIHMLEHIIEMTSVEEIYEYCLSYLENLINKFHEEKEEKKHYVIDKAVKYIEEQYYQNLTIEDVAEKFSMSTFYFSKLFKSCQSISFIDYLTDLRLKRAIEHFDDESYRINEIAIRVGYSDPNYFSRVFKKRYGVSPKEYRNRFL